MKCNHTDCLTCPYPECISPSGPSKDDSIENRVETRGRKKKYFNKKEHQKEYGKMYYQSHKKSISEWHKKYYAENKEHILERERQKRAERNGDVRVRQFTIWVTDGVNDRRIKVEQYDEYVAKGYKKGRTLKPYKLGDLTQDDAERKRVWVTDGENSKMIRPELLDVYLEKGYKIGRGHRRNI